jgi:hypothetical protein
MLVYFVATLNNIQLFGMFHGRLVYLVAIFPVFGILYQEKSGNPAALKQNIEPKPN